MLSHKKGFGQDQVFLLAGILILVITAWLIYTLIGGPYCDDMAKRTANNIKIAVDTVAKTGTYTKDSPYTTYAMLCQNKVGSPLTLNPIAYRAFSTPEYMIYWEHFPESPANLAEGLYKFDESYPFTKNFAQIAAVNIGLSFFSGTLSTLKKVGVTKTVADKITKSKAAQIANYFLLDGKVVKTATIPGKTITYVTTLPLKVIGYFGDLANRGITKSLKFAFKVTKISEGVEIVGKWITRSTARNIFGMEVGLGFLGSMADNYLIEVVKLSDDVAAEVGDDFAVKLVKAVDDETGETIQKAVVPSVKRTKITELVDSLAKSSIDEEREMGKNLQRYFAYTDKDLAGEAVEIPFTKLVQEAEKKETGFYGLIKSSMDTASESFERNSKIMAKKYGLYSHRPITSFFEQTGITRFNKNVNAFDVFRRMEFFDVDDTGKALLKPEIAENIQKRFADHKIKTEILDTEKMTDGVVRFFAGDKAIVAGVETDTAIVSFLESQTKEGLATDQKLYRRLLEGTATDADVGKVAASLSIGYKKELEELGSDEAGKKLFDSVAAKLDKPDYREQLVKDFSKELERAAKISGAETDDALEIAKFATAWKREPESLALMADESYEFLPYSIYDKLGGWEPKGTTKFMKMNLMSYTVSDVENDLKYSYIKGPNSGCESNTVCLNQKGVEQRKVDVAEQDIAGYETAYVVSKSVTLKLKRDGFTSPLGAGLGAFSFTDNPRFHLVSPCLAEIKFYESGTENGKPIIMADVDKCPTPGRSNYCYFDEGKFNEMAAGFYSALTCSVIADFGKFALVGFLLQPACSSIEVFTEYDTTWPFRPFQPLNKEHMNILNCNIEKNPKDAAKLATKACCGIAQCTGNFVCSGVDYAEKNRLICGADK
ncbi:MAG: hypothetical protein HY515_02300, partial [Candidatus Aenigmarchaeota archaeon]|nr:hypothetical protein [Candidatus Aenigmarchaeota archaeon]